MDFSKVLCRSAVPGRGKPLAVGQPVGDTDNLPGMQFDGKGYAFHVCVGRGEQDHVTEVILDNPSRVASACWSPPVGIQHRKRASHAGGVAGDGEGRMHSHTRLTAVKCQAPIKSASMTAERRSAEGLGSKRTRVIVLPALKLTNGQRCRCGGTMSGANAALPHGKHDSLLPLRAFLTGARARKSLAAVAADSTYPIDLATALRLAARRISTCSWRECGG